MHRVFCSTPCQSAPTGTFSEKYGIDSKVSYRLQLCSEELIYEMLKNCFPLTDTVWLNLAVEYSESEKSVILSCDCQGAQYNPFDAPKDDMHMGITIVRNASKKFEYQYKNSQNQIRINF